MGCSKRICEIYVQALDSFIKRREERGERRENTLDKTPQPLSTIQNNSEHEPQASELFSTIQNNSEHEPKVSEPLERAKHIERLNRSSAAIEPAPLGGARTQFVTTRFGNVLGSNGSVIPLFERQIKEGGPVTVTDPEIIRYFMLIPEACKLVLEAGTMGNGGEIFVFDMGKPVKIADLAKRMILLSGAKNIEIKYTGLRPGEKLYEEMLSTEENTKPSFHEKIRIATVREYDFEKVSRDIDELIAISCQYDDMATVRKMKEIVPEFISNNSVYSALDSK
jgi:FlaA1/EpsC-like NDP-sugar epimerase